MNEEILLIGVDGGATKASAWQVEHDEKNNAFKLSDIHSSLKYSEDDNFQPEFEPVAVPIQFQEKSADNLQILPAEARQGRSYTNSCADAVINIARNYPQKKVLLGIGMPGLKTPDLRGIDVIANGPRMPRYADNVEARLNANNINLLCPVFHLGSDADYCGIGEKYADGGSFTDVENAYYLGGGTGAADALVLRRELVPFDRLKTIIAKTWELKSDQDLSFERYASASGLQFIYSNYSGKSIQDLNTDKIYSPQIADRALSGDQAAVKTFADIAEYLSLLLYERIETLYCGWQQRLGFMNESKTLDASDDSYHGTLLDRIVIGQRLADLLRSRTGNELLAKPIISLLSKRINASTSLDEKAKTHYLHGATLRDERLRLSPLREAPALGAGIDAFLTWKNSSNTSN